MKNNPSSAAEQGVINGYGIIQSASHPHIFTEPFKKWFGDSKVVDEQDRPLVVYHGTTNSFTEFNRDRSNIENDMGAGFYFSNTPNDVAENYACEGPDLTSRIEEMAENLSKNGDEMNMDQARIEARNQLSEGSPNTVPVYLSMQNPVVLGGPSETFLDWEESFNEESESYSEPTGKLVGFVDALRFVAEDGNWYGLDVESSISDLFGGISDDGGIAASRLLTILKKSKGMQYATDDHEREVCSEIIRMAFQVFGFDGVIDNTVGKKFGSGCNYQKMSGMDKGTVHFIAFDPTQIKSAIGNSGLYLRDSPSLTDHSAAQTLANAAAAKSHIDGVFSCEVRSKVKKVKP